VYVQATGTQEAHRRVVVQAGHTSDVEVPLSPALARLRIVLNPSDAELGFDGQRLKGSPVEIADVRWGEHLVEISRDGFVSLRTKLVVDRSVVEYEFKLVPVTRSAIEPPAPQRALVPVSLSTSGYEVASGLPGILTLGILISEYTVELNGENVIDWRIRSATLRRALEPGRHHIRVLIRSIVGRAPQVWHDGPVIVAAGQPTEISINFLLNQIGVNGAFEWFNGKDFPRR
jgi:hypothetical protein